jgi:hypothetical protein
MISRPAAGILDICADFLQMREGSPQSAYGLNKQFDFENGVAIGNDNVTMCVLLA